MHYCFGNSFSVQVSYSINLVLEWVQSAINESLEVKELTSYCWSRPKPMFFKLQSGLSCTQEKPLKLHPLSLSTISPSSSSTPPMQWHKACTLIAKKANKKAKIKVFNKKELSRLAAQTEANNKTGMVHVHEYACIKQTSNKLAAKVTPTS